jgi:hypothetical protein
MSKAGVESNIGDEYQNLIAAYWTARMLIVPEINFIEVDSTSLSENGQPYFVDDIIIHYTDKKLTCCQCKRNSPNRKYWNISDLKDDLRKSWRQWKSTPNAELIFYSGDNFGDLAKLAARTRSVSDHAAFLYKIPKSLEKTYNTLAALINEGSLTEEIIFKFLSSLKFATFPYDTLHDIIRDTLSVHVIHADKAFKVISQEIDAVSRRSTYTDTNIAQGTRHTITRDNIIRSLSDAGLRLAPQKTITELNRYFKNLSCHGRLWPRTIKEHKFKRIVLNGIAALVTMQRTSILLHGGAGSGKTCVLLDLVDELETKPDICTIFIQTRDLDIAALDNGFLDNVARMAEIKKIVIVADSLDVLSISSHQQGFSRFLTILNESKKLDNVSIVAACRTFDTHYDRRLSAMEWSDTISLNDLDFESEVKPFLESLNIDVTTLDMKQKNLLSNPRMLSMYTDICSKGIKTSAINQFELAKSYIDTIINDSKLGNRAFTKIQKLASYMLRERRFTISKARANLPSDMAHKLLSEGILLETEQDVYTFGHQTLMDILAVAGADASDMTLTSFITALKPVPFIRPSIRTFIFYLRDQDAAAFRKQIKAAINGNLAFHIKRLIAVSLAEINPTNEDWPLIKHIFYKHPELFIQFFYATETFSWFQIFQQNFLSELCSTKNGIWILNYTDKLTGWPEVDGDLFVQMWIDALSCESVDKRQAAFRANITLNDFTKWSSKNLRTLFQILLDINDNSDTDSLLGKSLSRWVDFTNANDDMLWKYVTKKVKKHEDIKDSTLLCQSNDFYKDDFIHERMLLSTDLLLTAVNFLDEWAKTINKANGYDYSGSLLHYASYGEKRTRGSIRHTTSLTELFDALQNACQEHAENNSEWWRTHIDFLATSANRVLIYFAILGCTINPEPNTAQAVNLLYQIETHRGYFIYEFSCLLRVAAPFMAEHDAETIQRIVFDLYKKSGDEPNWAIFSRYDILIGLPSICRLPETQHLIDCVEKINGHLALNPRITSWGGMVLPPISAINITKLSDNDIIRLLAHYSGPNNNIREMIGDDLIGGAEAIAYQLSAAISIDPSRFSIFFNKHWEAIDPQFHEAYFNGIAEHIHYRFGDYNKPNDWNPISEPEPKELLTTMLSMMLNHELAYINAHSWANALEACADIALKISDIYSICDIIKLYADEAQEPDIVDEQDLLNIGLGSVRGIMATAVIKMANRLLENKHDNLPAPLVSLLRRFAADKHPAVRAMILYRLHRTQYYNKSIGWELFDLCIIDAPGRIWKNAYSCLRYSYFNDFERISKYIHFMERNCMPDAGEYWAMLMALSFISKKIEQDELFTALMRVNAIDAWKGAASVFSYNINNQYDRCLAGLTYILAHAPKHSDILCHCENVLLEEHKLPLEFISLLITYAYSTKRDGAPIHHFIEWLARVAPSDCLLAVSSMELALETIYKTPKPFYFYNKDDIAIFLTHIFREAEENEELDGGQLLNRVIAIQDALLSKGINSVDNWLKDAERP